MVLTYLLLWLVMLVTAVVNGTLRDFTYGKVLGDLPGHIVSSIIFCVALYFIVQFGSSFRPLETAGEAALVGVVWAALTVAFEAFMVVVLEHKPWTVVFEQYNLAHGRVWGLVVLWIGILPSVAAMQ